MPGPTEGYCYAFRDIFKEKKINKHEPQKIVWVKGMSCAPWTPKKGKKENAKAVHVPATATVTLCILYTCQARRLQALCPQIKIQPMPGAIACLVP